MTAIRTATAATAMRRSGFLRNSDGSRQIPYVISVVGHSGSGKTRLIERLVPLLNKRGLKVGTAKHAHDRIDLDRPGKDSWRHVQAGAEAAAVVGPKQLMFVKRRQAGEGLSQALEMLPAKLDLILLEGFHGSAYPQIVVAGRTGRVRHGRHVIAIVSDRPAGGFECRFGPGQIRELAAFIEGEWMRQWEASQCHPSQGLSSAAV